MMVLKLIGKLLALPVILVLAVLLGAVKLVVGIYNFARTLFVILSGILVVLVYIYYRDWMQIAFVLTLVGISMAILMIGVFFEVVIESMISSLGEFIMS